MARKHRFSIVVMLSAAVVAGFVALSRSVQLGAASKPASTAQVSARARSLDRLEAQLRDQLATLAKTPPEEKPVATRSASPGVLYVRSPASPVAATHGDDDEHDAEAHGSALGEAGGDD